MRIGNDIRVERVAGGVPSIVAPNGNEAVKALGYMHVVDRGCQMEISRLMALGRSAQYLAPMPTLIKMDTFVRRMGIYQDPRKDIALLSPRTREYLKSYVAGVNLGWRARSRPVVFHLWRYRPVPWTEADVIRILRFTSFMGLASTQISLERGLIEMVRRGIGVDKLTDLFGDAVDGIDLELIQSIDYRDRAQSHEITTPGLAAEFRASNAWALSGRLSGTNGALLAGDPHADINRLPALWYEAEMHSPDQSVAGATAPGLPVVLFGRNRHLGWSMTSSPSDTVDYFVEECRNGEHKIGRSWVPMQRRKEEVPIRGGEVNRFTVFASVNGVLLGDATKAGRYLSLRWTGVPGAFAKTVDSFMELHRSRSVEEALPAVRGIEFPSAGWVLADDQGHVGSQVSGRIPGRKDGWSGLYPVPGWLKENAWKGTVDSLSLPTEFDPECGFVAFANQPVNPEDGPAIVSGAPPSYRFQRIQEVLSQEGQLSLVDMQHLQYDVTSKQAQRLLPVFLAHLHNPDAALDLGDWHCDFTASSRRATMFHNIYRAALMVTFGEGGLGRDYLSYLLDETSFYTSAAEGIDNVLCNPESAWFRGRDYRKVMEEAVREGLLADNVQWGEISVVNHRNAIVGTALKVLPRINQGPHGMNGHHSTIHQSTHVRDHGVDGVFGPSYHFVTDMGSKTMWTNLPGGPSENPLSRFYSNDLGRWRFGDYKRIKLQRRLFES